MSKKTKSKSSRSFLKSKPRPGLKRRASRKKTREVAIATVKDDLSRYLRLAEDEEIVITRHGRPAAVLIGFASEDDWLEYRLENHPEFLRRIEMARAALGKGKSVPIDKLPV